MRKDLYLFFLLLLLVVIRLPGQISPGDLSRPHQELEGMSNCTQCHVLGKTVSDDKCLSCHTDVRELLKLEKGYHSSSQVKDQNCTSCHSDHHGKNFEMVRFDTKSFDHLLAGYELSGKHKKLDCRECHTPDLIADNDIKKRNETFLGLGSNCVDCHEDIHLGTLDQNCISCHSTTEFTPVTKFDHSQTDFALKGQHKVIDCKSCHQPTLVAGNTITEFAGLEFKNCTSCHEDEHNNKFGQNCTSCHTENSFTQLKSMNRFNHNLTDYPLQGLHTNVDCRECHAKAYSDPLPHSTCSSCHDDYHENQFAGRQGGSDCAACHTLEGFSGSLYTLTDHNESKFPLVLAHSATPCFQCHQEDKKWSFRNIGEKCIDCHDDIHSGDLADQYYPDKECTVCHTLANWQENNFDHEQTPFTLSGAHVSQDCRACHTPDTPPPQKSFVSFVNTQSSCVTCHEDNHRGQFEKNGVTDCASCHTSENWKNSFDHNRTQFALTGKHTSLACIECHQEKLMNGERIVEYKLNRFECIDCHF